MDILEPIIAAVVVAALLYTVDRGLAFHICLFRAIASKGGFRAEEAYRAMDNPFVKAPKILFFVLLVGIVLVLSYRGGMQSKWGILLVVSVALTYTSISGFLAIKAFQKTRFAKFSAD